MIPSFRPIRVITLLLFVYTVYASRFPTQYKRSRNRVSPLERSMSKNERSLVERAAPSGWSLHVKSGNDGGGCYIDSSAARILTGYAGTDANNGLQSCLTTCRSRGFAYGGVQYGTQCFVSPSCHVDIRLTTSAGTPSLPTSLPHPLVNATSHARLRLLTNVVAHTG